MLAMLIEIFAACFLAGLAISIFIISQNKTKHHPEFPEGWCLIGVVATACIISQIYKLFCCRWANISVWYNLFMNDILASALITGAISGLIIRGSIEIYRKSKLAKKVEEHNKVIGDNKKGTIISIVILAIVTAIYITTTL